MSKRINRNEPMCLTSEKSAQVIDRNEMRRIKSAVGRRLIESFGRQPDEEIAFLLKTSRAKIESFIEGSKLPSTEILLSVHRATGVSIHWLLTGEGSKRTDYQAALAAPPETAIFGLA